MRARSNPENIDAVKAEVTADWPMAGLLDMVKEVDLRLGFTDALGSPTAYEALDRTELRSRRLLCLYGLGTNAGLRRLDASRDGPGQREKLRAGVHGQDRGGADVNRAVKWVPAEGAGAEHLSIRSIADGVVAEGVVVGARGGTPYGSRYRVACDARWRVREAVLSLAGKERRLHLRGDGEGNWQDGAGQPVEALRGCVDIDISATPFTKYLADSQARARARRGDETLVAYVAVPALVPEAVRQRYTCLEAGRLYRYEELFRGYVGELNVDEDSLILDYPGTFRRVP